ncbi:MAG: potassium channel protein [Dehalococcoidia bacterium]|nr:potassium channel protein [Dehalococcoidia bacterium]MDD5647600.1 potassium channel protein [Dehalococcoidia bacterium]
MGNRNHYIIWLSVLIALFAFGSAGYMLIEHWDFFDSFYMTVITIATLGGETHPLTGNGRIFTIILTLVGVGTVIYILTSIVQATLETEFGSFRRSRMEARIRRLNNHFVLCGYGRVGEAIAGTLKKQKSGFVVIDHSLNSFNRAVQDGCLSIMDDATNHEVLKRAGIEKARGLITAFGDDAYNTYAVLTAREINPVLTIISRANNNDAVRRLKQAGATHIILPEVIGGQQMARLALRPSTVQFIETVLADNEGEYLVEEVYIDENSTLIGKTIKDLEEKFAGVRIMAIREKDGDVLISPTLNTTIEIGGSLTAFGTMQQLQEIEGCCSLTRDSSGRIVPDL